MCGIAGIVAPKAARYHDALQRITDSPTHRGRDGEGRHFFQNCALGHRRLAIIDIESGAQPMRSHDGRTTLTFNGEIYGYLGLRSRLGAYPYRTHSDTEVILALYAHYGNQALAHLPGVFAFAIWDEASQELSCAQDRFGEKPFYYAIGRSGEFIFASEIKSIIASGLVDPGLDPSAVTRYLRKQYVRANQSSYKNIYFLGPAQRLSYKDGKIQITDYWSISAAENDIGLDEAIEQFDSLLHSAIRKQLIADAAVGTFRSDGLDSSTIRAVAKELAGDLNTFSFDFEGDHSEAPFARAVASAKVSLNEDKIILRQAFSLRWPEMIRKCSKQGFGVPVVRWLQASTVCKLNWRFLRDVNSLIYQLLSYSGTRNVSQRCNPLRHWSLLVVAAWFAGTRSEAA